MNPQFKKSFRLEALLNLYLDSLGFHVLVHQVFAGPYIVTSLQGQKLVLDRFRDKSDLT